MLILARIWKKKKFIFTPVIVYYSNHKWRVCHVSPSQCDESVDSEFVCSVIHVLEWLIHGLHITCLYRLDLPAFINSAIRNSEYERHLSRYIKYEIITTG